MSFQEKVIGNGAQVHFGVDGDGIDTKFFGATGSAYLLWDESNDQLVTSGAAYIGGRTDANGIGLAVNVKTTTGDPSSTGTPVGSMVDNTFDDELLVWNGSNWIGLALS